MRGPQELFDSDDKIGILDNVWKGIESYVRRVVKLRFDSGWTEPKRSSGSTAVGQSESEVKRI